MKMVYKVRYVHSMLLYTSVYYELSNDDLIQQNEWPKYQTEIGIASNHFAISCLDKELETASQQQKMWLWAIKPTLS